MPTLKEKKLLNEHVTAETKRCLKIVKEVYMDSDAFDMISEDILNELYEKAVKAIIEGCPYVEFRPELRRNWYFASWKKVSNG
jgi:hypothetical protein